MEQGSREPDAIIMPGRNPEGDETERLATAERKRHLEVLL